MFPDEQVSEDELIWDEFGCTLRPHEFQVGDAARAGMPAAVLVSRLHRHTYTQIHLHA